MPELPATRRRLFVGIVLDETVRSACAALAERLRATAFPARYEDPAKFHLTLAFLGTVEASRCDDLALAMSRACDGCGCFEFTLDNLGAFPHERKPRVVYAGARTPGAAFRALAGAVRRVYWQHGFTFATDCVAHVTIARAKPPYRQLPAIDVAPMRVEVTALSLFESTFANENGTAKYEVLAQAFLSAG